VSGESRRRDGEAERSTRVTLQRLGLWCRRGGDAIGSNAGGVARGAERHKVQQRTGKRGVWWSNGNGEGKKEDRTRRARGGHKSRMPGSVRAVSPIIHLHRAVSCSAALLRWRASVQKCLPRMTPPASTICVGGQLAARACAQSHLASRPHGADEWRRHPRLLHAGLAGWSSSAGQLASWQREALGGADMQMRMSDENPRQAHAAAAGSLGRRALGRCGMRRCSDAAMRLCWAGGGHARSQVVLPRGRLVQTWTSTWTFVFVSAVQGGPPGSRVWRGILIGHRVTGPCTWDNSLRGRDTLNLWPEQLAVEAAAAPP
jgi:hypothetical protein